MGRIHILDSDTVNKIAAGEVIERPSSVVKELIENSIDAQASDIRIEVIKGGKKLIRVRDNGHGMSREDASISFMKHATSKIKRIEDIENLTTMGFRGEALSSITFVAKVEIITKTRDQMSGTKVVIHGGKLISINETGAPNGTTITVEELFYNTPARKKYLKSDSTELAHIIDVVTKNALGHNNISFSLSHNGKQLLHSPASLHLLDTIVHIYGKEVAKSMLPVNLESRFATIHGYLSKPEITRGSISFQSFYINDRNITSKNISSALRKGYGSLIPKGRFPIAVLKLYIDRKDVDINVHPTKREVRLNHETEISDAVTQAVRIALRNKNLILKPQSFHTQKPQIKEANAVFSIRDTERRLRHTEQDTKNIEVRILGHVDNMYVIAEIDKGIVIIDQHAAHERVLFEQLRHRKNIATQELIVPINLELDHRERVMIKECIPYLEEVGFHISEFGPHSFAVTSIPRIFGKLVEAEVIHDIITNILSEGRIKDDTNMFERVTRNIACKGAIKAGADFSNEQMQKLVKQLLSTQNPYTCPHGRPTMILFNRKELDRLFHRS